MKRSKDIKVNALRAEIQRQKEIVWKERRRADAADLGAAEAIALTEKAIIAALRASGMAEVELAVDMADPASLVLERTEKGFRVKIIEEGSTKPDNVPAADGV